MKSVLVTGANGFLGRYVVDHLIQNSDIKVKCLVRKGSNLNGLPEQSIEIVRGSLNNEQDVREALQDVDVVVHLAASLGGSPMGMFIETVVSTEILIDVAKDFPIKKMVFCSSFSVYGASLLRAGSTLDEASPIEPNPEKRDAYGWCKFYQEEWVRDNLPKSTTLAIVRPGVIYGEDKGFLGPRIGLRLPGIGIFLQIGTRARLPLTHVQNCSEAIALCATNDQAEGIFNIVDDDLPTQSAYVKAYQRRFGKIRKRVIVPYRLFLLVAMVFERFSRLSKGNLPPVFTKYKTQSMYKRINYSNKRAKEILAWTPQVNLEEGLKIAHDLEPQ